MRSNYLSDANGHTIKDAVAFLHALMFGSGATALAVIAVAFVGLLMLRGRLPARRAALVTLGCFILFGAPAIAAGIVQLTTVDTPMPSFVEAPPPPVPNIKPQPPSTPYNPYDPYAGASVPPPK